MTIMGILTMGIIKSKSLLDQARLEKTISQIESIVISVESFKNIYYQLPGDYSGSEFKEAGDGTGILDTPNKQKAFWMHLEKSDILKKPVPTVGGVFSVVYENENYLTLTGTKNNGALTFNQAKKITIRIDNSKIKNMETKQFIETEESTSEKKYAVYVAL